MERFVGVLIEISPATPVVAHPSRWACCPITEKQVE
jgi:hypothetical protein